MRVIVLDHEGAVVLEETEVEVRHPSDPIMLHYMRPLSFVRIQDETPMQACPFTVARAWFEQYRGDGVAVFRREADFHA